MYVSTATKRCLLLNKSSSLKKKMDWPVKDFLQKDKKFKHKETRWNRIRKKHLNNLTVTTSTVKKFINMNFIDENEIRHMADDENHRKNMLNPVVVMNVRHEMIRNKPKAHQKDVTPTKELLKVGRFVSFVSRNHGG